MRDEFYDHIESAANRTIRAFLEALAMTGVVAIVGFAGFLLGTWR